jgi:hypothetical protein
VKEGIAAKRRKRRKRGIDPSPDSNLFFCAFAPFALFCGPYFSSPAQPDKKAFNSAYTSFGASSGIQCPQGRPLPLTVVARSRHVAGTS